MKSRGRTIDRLRMAGPRAAKALKDNDIALRSSSFGPRVVRLFCEVGELFAPAFLFSEVCVFVSLPVGAIWLV